jgi:hypothetical protein
MKSRFLMSLTAITLFAALAVGLAAQDNHNHHKHHHYQFIDLGTFGGPTSRNDGIYPPLNNQGKSYARSARVARSIRSCSFASDAMAARQSISHPSNRTKN